MSRTGPSPVGAFARRVVGGRWDWPALAAGVPALAVGALAVLIGVVTGHTLPRSGVGWWARTRLALALLVQGLGGSLRISEPSPAVYGGSYDSLSGSGSDGTDGTDGTDGFGDSGTDFSHFGGSGGSDGYDGGSDGYDGGSDGYDGGTGSFGGLGGGHSSSGHRVHETLSVMPLSVTLLWIGLMVVVLRAARKRQAGPEAAVRVTVLATAAALVLALIGQVHMRGSDVSGGPFLVAVGAFLISLATSLAVLAGPGLAGRLAARPALAAGYRVLRAAVRALLAAVLLSGLVCLVVTACYYDDVTGWGLAAAALLLPNLGVSGLSLGWGGPLVLRTRVWGDRTVHRTLGLSDLGHVWGGWGLVLAVGTGLVCALLIGRTALRSRNRLEQFAVAGVFTALFAGLAALAGVATSGIVGQGGLMAGSAAHSSVSSDVPKALLFGLLWSVGGVLVTWYAAKAAGRPTPAPYVPAPRTRAPAPYGHAYSYPPGVPPVPPPGHAPGPVPPQPSEPPVMDLGIVQPDRLSEKPPRQE
ncbi:hypothetical protein [Streptomyces sp. HPF1205]|uniref:hypothetical protein n=1 Tax=Streptomyces sp. HPF1205 TaxID=2873262 RepID=UPI001CEC5962|nr:hypothetical protein [Streptomyces sp. HPF1205]